MQDINEAINETLNEAAPDDVNADTLRGEPSPAEGTAESAQEGTPASAEGGETILHVSGLTKSYGELRALDGVSFDIPSGRIIGLLGPNGSGKSTFIKIVAGLLTSDAGEVNVLGNPIGVATKALVAYLPERNSIPLHFTVGEAVDFYQDFFPDFDRELALNMLSSLRVDPRLRIKTLSKGTKEKVQLVMVMARRAALYLLDEPISGVDPAARDFIISTILKSHSPKSSVIISTHLITDIETVMDGFILLKDGRVRGIGTPEGLMRSRGQTVDEYFREVFRC